MTNIYLAAQAINYYQKSLSYSKNVEGDEINISSTHLNICSLFSQMGDHERAYKHGKMSLKFLPIAYKRLKESSLFEQNKSETTSSFSVLNENDPNKQTFDNLLMTLVIAYYNTGTEWEYLDKYDEALHNFEKGYEWSYKTIGKADQLTKNLKKWIKQVKRKLGRSDERSRVMTTNSNISLETTSSLNKFLRKKIKSR